MYIGTQQDYKKYQAPDASNVVIEQEVGIEEQHQPPEACSNEFQFTDYFGFAASWVGNGLVSLIADTSRLSQTAGVVLQDPASGVAPDSKCSVEVSTIEGYQIAMPLSINSGPTMVEAILPAINNGTAITIASVFYFSGTSGRCVIVPTQSPVEQALQNQGPTPSPYSDMPLSALARGSLVSLSGGAGTETVFVLSVTIGPTGTICFECVTTLAFITGDSITGKPAIYVSGVTPAAAGTAITCRDVTFLINPGGVATISENLGAARPFNVISADGTSITQQYDYVQFSVNISDMERLVAVTFIFNTNPSVTFDKDGFYYQVTASDLISHPPVQTQVDALFAQFHAGLITLAQLTEQVNALSILPASQYTTLLVPITSLKRFGGNTGLTLSDTNGIRMQVETTGTMNVRFGPFYVGIGDQPDIGKAGSQYKYITRTRSSLTGARSNPSPEPRYGITARRQGIRISMTDTNTDTQDDTWDIFRIGGTITTFRYIGSQPVTGGVDIFTDNYFDTAAEGGSVLEYDNFQPWPTIDIPFSATAGTVDGVTTTITVCGTVVIITYSAAAPFASPAPASILRWLPGTILNMDGQNAFTLWNRPVLFIPASPPSNYFSYMFRLVENAGAITPNKINIVEPNVANQSLPYLWGPDAEGTVFGCGDPLRPGTLYYCKAFTPDSAPDNYNQEIVPPSEPLLGGKVVNGLAFTGSSKRWWALYPNFGSGVRYQTVEKPVKRGIAAPYAYDTDGKTIFFVADDGIWDLEGNSLTDADLHNLFPHEGVPGQDYGYAGLVIQAPDYKYASQFRLAYKNNYIYFDYRDSTGSARTLVCDYRDQENPTWVPDKYADPISVHYGIEQQAGTLLTSTLAYEQLIMGDDNGGVHVQTDLANDNGVPITGIVATQEYNGGDLRANQLFDDEFLDLIPASPTGVQALIQSNGSAVIAPVVIPSSPLRVQTSIPIGIELKYMGIMLTWLDDFTLQTVPTLLRAWQPRYQAVPIKTLIWTNQGTSFGLTGYLSIPYLLFAYKAIASVIITISVADGTAPVNITLPSTGGALKKTMFRLSPNKGLLYFITGQSVSEWQPYLSDCEIYIAQWGRGGEMTVIRDIAASKGIKS
jgi:hypothetical protein